MDVTSRGSTRLYLFVATAIAALALGALPAQATILRVCQVQDRWVFSNPLGVNPVPTGTTATLDINGLCFYDNMTPQLIDGGGTFTVSGTCLAATLSSAAGAVGAITGGLVAATFNIGPAEVRFVGLLPAPLVCNETTATGTGVVVNPTI